MTNYELLNLDTEIGNLPSLLRYLLKSPVNEFYRTYGIRIETTKKKLGVLQREYFVIDRDKIVVTEPPVVSPRKKTFIEKIGLRKAKPEPSNDTFMPMPKMQEGKSREDFEKAYQDLMKSEINISLARV